MDVALLWLLLRAGVWTPAAVTVAYVAATAAQFFANRHYTFRAADRPAALQGVAYALVCVANWLVALGCVEAAGAWFALSPMAAKALSIPPSAAVSFLGNRYFTFASSSSRGAGSGGAG